MSNSLVAFARWQQAFAVIGVYFLSFFVV